MIEPFLNFNGQANDAIKFYEDIFNTKASKIVNFAEVFDTEEFKVPEELRHWVDNGEILINQTNVGIADLKVDCVPNSLVSMRVYFNSEEEIINAYRKLLDEGISLIDLMPYDQLSTKLFGWVQDKYGVNWQLIYK